MLSSLVAASMISLSGAASMAGSPARPAVLEPVVQLVDARDLVSAMPSSRGNPVTAVSEIVMGVSDALHLRAVPLSDGIYTVTGEPETHAQFGALLNQVRDLYNGQYEVELACYPAAAPPEIGSVAKVEGASMRVRQAVSRRQECRVESSRSVAYIAKWQPVVADNSVGYDAQTERASAGLMVTILVGAGPDTGGVVDIRVRGEISEIELRELTVPLMGDKGGLPVQLPTTNMRSINADGRIGAEARVIGVVPGFRPGEVMVIAASARAMTPR